MNGLVAISSGVSPSDICDAISPNANGASNAGDAAIPSPLPKTLKPVFAIPGLGFFFSIPKALDLLALIVDGAASAVEAANVPPNAGS